MSHVLSNLLCRFVLAPVIVIFNFSRSFNFFKNGQSHESHEGDGRHESHACLKKKVISARTAVRQAFAGKISKTNGGLTASSLIKNKHGRVVSKKQSLKGKKNAWILAVSKARKELKIKGFCAVKKGTEFYKKAKSFM